MQSENQEIHAPSGRTKVDVYQWKTTGQPGRFQMIHKSQLRIVQDSYQRVVRDRSVAEYAANWNWASAGALIIGNRDGVFYVIDGQHRLLAARKRADISELPCLVFDEMTEVKEAQAFLDVNKNRSVMRAHDTHNAAAVAGDELAAYVNRVIEETGLSLKKCAKNVGETCSVAWCLSAAKKDRKAFEEVLAIAARLSAKDQMPVKEILLGGLMYLHEHLDAGLNDRRLMDRMNVLGSMALIQAAKRSAAMYVTGGARIYALGMLHEINKGLRNKFCLKGDRDAE